MRCKVAAVGRSRWTFGRCRLGDAIMAAASVGSFTYIRKVWRLLVPHAVDPHAASVGEEEQRDLVRGRQAGSRAFPEPRQAMIPKPRQIGKVVKGTTRDWFGPRSPLRRLTDSHRTV
jgi:hypothetical protein